VDSCQGQGILEESSSASQGVVVLIMLMMMMMLRGAIKLLYTYALEQWFSNFSLPRKAFSNGEFSRNLLKILRKHALFLNYVSITLSGSLGLLCLYPCT
jgi:hypothetical protein